MHAYLDPGSGSMLLGLFASGLAGIVVIFKTFGHRIMSVLTFWKKDEPAVAEPARAALRSARVVSSVRGVGPPSRSSAIASSPQA